MKKFIPFFTIPLIVFFPADAQSKAPVKKYPSLFWEITGNGLQKPSYLFGTMHVSSKTVFHLSDSFYYAMRHTDVVALELNPEMWQDEMFRLQKFKLNLAGFSAGRPNDYLTEKSFRIERYEDDIKKAITEEPVVVNNLLYRSYEPNADYEENTYLDLYIYQTGRRMGKQPAGVENYLESERLMTEAYKAMAKEKSKKRIDTNGESMYEIQKKIQQAYRNGDLDLLDSLQNITLISSAFSEKFLYLRNGIQANSIDTILKRRSLFAGVGAAHLPGPRGVIELLRKKGFHLRPIFMQDRDASQKDEIDKLRVPVIFQPQATSDGVIQLQLPGKLYKREEAGGNENWQYADMNNGSYYTLTRVRTHAAMMGHTEKTVLHKVDSMLYENIPGKILKKTIISRNGYAGFDITNRTRRGDLQRYEIIITPFEVLVFKMSGNDQYVDGNEADQFFNSIKVKAASSGTWTRYEPEQGGFKLKFPGSVYTSFSEDQPGETGRWQYESTDNSSGNGYMVWKKSVQNSRFIEEDTFELALMEESFKSSEIISKQLSRRTGIKNRKPYLESTFSLKDGGFATIRCYVTGPHFYLLATNSKSKKGNASLFLNSFRLTPFRYPTAQYYVDSSLRIKVWTAVKPEADTGLQLRMENQNRFSVPEDIDGYTGWAKTKNGVFKSELTGESVFVSLQEYPRYFFSTDSTAFWNDRFGELQIAKDMQVRKKAYFKLNDSVYGYRLLLTDTNSAACIKIQFYLQGNNFVKLSAITDTSQAESSFIKTFFATAAPANSHSGASVFANKTATFFQDFYSKDSVTAKLAAAAIPDVQFGKGDVTKLVTAIDKLKYTDEDYFENKSKFIAALGSINDSAAKEDVVKALEALYKKNADTSYFQNAVISALARLKTKSSYNLLKDLVVHDPPIFDDKYEYGRIFGQFLDTLQLAKTLLPEILQLASLEDYKPYINSLLMQMADSSFVKASDYESYFSKLYFDAKIELKKQQNKDEKQLERENSRDGYERNDIADYENIYNSKNGIYANTSFAEYASLLIPFYDTFSTVSKYFDKLLASKDVRVQLTAAKVLLAHNKKIPDSLFASTASQDRYRVRLFNMLYKMNRLDMFPKQYLNQQMMAEALLLNDKGYRKFSEVEPAGTQVIKTKERKGNLYLFRYKINKDDDWKIGISGLQPLNVNEVNSNTDFVKLTDKKLNVNEPWKEQFDVQIKKLVLARHKSFDRFYDNSDSYLYSTDLGVR